MGIGICSPGSYARDETLVPGRTNWRKRRERSFAFVGSCQQKRPVSLKPKLWLPKNTVLQLFLSRFVHVVVGSAWIRTLGRLLSHLPCFRRLDRQLAERDEFMDSMSHATENQVPSAQNAGCDRLALRRLSPSFTSIRPNSSDPFDRYLQLKRSGLLSRPQREPSSTLEPTRCRCARRRVLRQAIAEKASFGIGKRQNVPELRSAAGPCWVTGHGRLTLRAERLHNSMVQWTPTSRFALWINLLK
jgi:hypothetical protein